MNERNGKTIHVVNQTHWDREWLVPFEVYRADFLDYMDYLLDLMESCPDYKHFLLDGQSVCVEDYLELRPENRERLKRLVSSGRVLPGPWYTPPDMNITSGESIVRNLLTGIKSADELGGAMLEGYTPCSNGQISQLPQIYAGFGIDSIIVYKGVWEDKLPREFMWASPDGTEVFTMRLSSRYGRGEFYALVFHQVVCGVFHEGESSNWYYSLREDSLPYKVSGLMYTGPDVFRCLKKEECFYPEHLESRVRRLCDFACREASSSQIVVFNGMDHTPPFASTPKLIKEASGAVPGITFRESSLPEAVGALKDEVVFSDLKKHEGELRGVRRGGSDRKLNIATLSSRMDIKISNRETEHLLSDIAEPLSSLGFLLGGDYPSALLGRAWKLLLLNHAHDSIDGCNSDKVNEDVLGRFSSCKSLCEAIIDRAVGGIIKRSSAGRVKPRLLAVNPSLREKSFICEAEVDLPGGGASQDIRLKDSDGRDVLCQAVGAPEKDVTVSIKDTIGRSMRADRIKLLFEAEDIPPMGWSEYRLFSGEKAEDIPALSKTENELDNGLLNVKIREDGRIDIVNRETGRKYSGLHYFSVGGDAGDPWKFEPVDAEPVTSLNNPAKIERVMNGPLKAVYRVKNVMDVPASWLNPEEGRAELVIISDISLERSAKWVEINTSVYNKSKNYKLTACFPSGIDSESTYAGGQYDILERPVEPPFDMTGWDEPVTAYPNYGFFGVRDEKDGLSILNIGLPEYFTDEKDRRTLTLTLLRGTQLGHIWPEGHESVQGGHCTGKTVSRYAIYPHTGGRELPALFGDYTDFAVKPLCAEYFGGGMPEGRKSLLRLESSALMAGCVKKSEDGDGIVIRLWNPSERKEKGTVKTAFGIEEAEFTGLDEKPRAVPGAEIIDTTPESVTFELGKKKVATLMLGFRP